MPNHIHNVLKFIYHDDSGQMLKKIAEQIKGENGAIDFNNIIPQPENVFNGDLGQKEEEFCAKNNIPTWYDWNRENWGTKWNAYESKIENLSEWSFVVYFQTAWNRPRPIINKLIHDYPDVEITHVSACDGGWFSEMVVYNEGKATIATWDNETDKGGTIRSAMLESLRRKY